MQYVADLFGSQSELFYLWAVAFFCLIAGVVVGWMLTIYAYAEREVYPTPESDRKLLDKVKADGLAYHLGYVAGESEVNAVNPYPFDCDEYASWYLGNEETKYKNNPSIMSV